MLALQIRHLEVGSGNSQLHIIQDDLLHPVLGGNKLRKLDGLLPELQAKGCTDVVSGKSNPNLAWAVASRAYMHEAAADTSPCQGACD